jgi:hypothetical protein
MEAMFVLMTALALADPQQVSYGILSVTTGPAGDGRTAVEVELAGADLPATVTREGAWVFVQVPGGAPEVLALPRPQPPIVTVQVEADALARGLLALEAAPPFEYVAVREGRRLRLLFSAVSAADDVETLARMLWPAEATLSAPEGPPPPPRGPRLRLRPSMSALYATGTNGFDQGPQPVADSYYDLGPRIDALSGPARVSYEAHIRRESRYADVNSTTTHLLDANLARQLASDANLSVSYQFLRGRQQTNAVDAGGEYFYGLKPFDKHALGARTAVPLGGATALEVAGSWGQVRFDEPATFTDFSSWTAQGGLRRDIGGESSLELLYTHEKVYEATDSNVAGTFADTIDAALVGEIRPRLHVLLQGGLSRRRSPGAPGAAQTLNELITRLEVQREFSDTTAFALGYQRSRNISAFEDNPSYGSELVEARGHAPLPFEISLAAKLGFRENRYPLPAAEIGAARRDRIYGWAAGLGRTLGRFMAAHVEYTWQRRDSNIRGLSSHADGLVIQLDVAPGREGARP